MTARAVAALILVVLFSSACGEGPRPELIPLPGDPGHLIEVNGHRLYFRCLGAGEPTVLLEAGYGSDHHSWDVIEPELARTTRTCEYEPPYVVAGHSYGGILAWLFAREHRDDVDGLVLLDSSHPEQQSRFLAIVPRPSQPEQVSPENAGRELRECEQLFRAPGARCLSSNTGG